MKYYPSLANVVRQADCSQGLNVRSAEGKAIACQSTEGRRRLERSGRHLRSRIEQSGGSGGRLNVDSGLLRNTASPVTTPYRSLVGPQAIGCPVGYGKGQGFETLETPRWISEPDGILRQPVNALSPPVNGGKTGEF